MLAEESLRKGYIKGQGVEEKAEETVSEWTGTWKLLGLITNTNPYGSIAIKIKEFCLLLSLVPSIIT